MAIKLGEDNIDKVYVGGVAVERIYLGEDQVWPDESGEQVWTVQRWSDDYMLADFNLTYDELPETITEVGVDLFQIYTMAVDGSSYGVYWLDNGIPIDVFTVSSKNTFQVKINGVLWVFSLPSPYVIKIVQIEPDIGDTDNDTDTDDDFY